MAVTTTTRFGITRWSDPADPFTRVQMDTSHAQIEALGAIDVQDLLANRPAPGTRGRFFSESSASAGLPGTTWRDDGSSWRSVGSRIVAASATDTGQVVQGAVSQSTNLTEWRNSAGTVLASIGSGGALNVPNISGVTTITSATISLLNSVAGTIPQTIKGASGQTADLTQWQNNAGTVLAKVTAGGLFQLTQAGAYVLAPGGFGGGTAGFADAAARNQFNGNAASEKVVVIRGVTSQSANLTEWQDPTGAYLAGVSNVGFMNAGKGIQAANINVSGSWRNAFGALNTNEVALVAQGMSGQTADVFQARDWSNNVLAVIRNNDRHTVNFTPAASTAWTWTEGGGSTAYEKVSDGFSTCHSIKVCGTGSPYANTLTISLPPSAAYGSGSGVGGAGGTSAAGHPLGFWAVVRSGSIIANGVIRSQGGSTEAIAYSWGGGAYSFQPASGDQLLTNWNYFGQI